MDAFYFVSELMSFKPDIVHTHLGRATRRIQLSSRLTNTKHVASLHMGYRKSDYQKCDALICVAEWQRATLGEFKKPSLVIRNWFEPCAKANPSYVESLKLALHIKQGDFIFGAITRLHPGKNVTTIIEAFNQAFPKRDGVHLIIIGDGEARRDLEHSAGEALGRGIHFVGYQKSIPDWLSLLNCFVSASSWEGMPLSVIEALGEGIPTVLSLNAGHQEIAYSQSVGSVELFEVGDVLALSTRMQAAFLAGPVRMKYNLNPFSRTNAGISSIRFYEDLLKS